MGPDAAALRQATPQKPQNQALEGLVEGARPEIPEMVVVESLDPAWA